METAARVEAANCFHGNEHTEHKDGDGDGEEEEGEDEDDENNPAIDGGWGWMIVAASLLINIIYDGCSYSFGIFFTNFLDYFGDSKSKTAWIGSLFFSVPLLCGPIAGVVSQKMGYRKSTILGGAIATLGFVLGAFVNSTELLCVTYGVIAGFGMSLPYFNSIVVVAEYFRKKRALATGIAECGAGVGTIIFAPLTDYLIVQYGWRGAVFIMGGIVANIIVCGALYRPLSNNVIGRKYKVKKNANKSGDHLEEGCLMEKTVQKASSLKNLVNPEKHQRVLGLTSTQSRSLNNLHAPPILHVSHLSRSSLAIQSHETDVLKKGTLSTTSVSCSSSSQNGRYDRMKIWIEKNVGDFSMFTYSPFLLFALSNFIMYFWYDVPYVFLVDNALSIGISDFDSTFLVSIIGIVHTVGNIAYGLVADREDVNKTILYGVSIMLCGVSIFLVPYFESYSMLAILAAGFGLFSAANEALCSIILVDIVGLAKLNQAYGVIMMLQGIANLVGPPVAGMLCDVSGEYSPTFTSAGCCVTLAGLVYLILPVIKGRCNSKGDNCPNTALSEQTTPLENAISANDEHIIRKETTSLVLT